MHDYYEQNHAAYFERTVRIDPASFLEPFAAHLPAGASVLDAGCGSGRDLLWLKNRGFQVTGFERSPGLAARARAHAKCRVIEGDFTSYDFSKQSFDALLLCGALVHIPPDRLAAVLNNLLKSIHKRGWVYLSQKEGRGPKCDPAGRTFHCWQPQALEKIFQQCGLRILDVSRSISAAGTGEPWLGYVLAVGHRA